MKISLCNEVIREMDFASQCQYVAALGYDGLEVAPFTLGENPHRLPSSTRAELRGFAADAGIEITSLHWLLVTPPGLSINSRESSVRQRTVEVMQGLIDLCADLGGRVLVHGSPAQRSVSSDDSPSDAWLRARDCFAAAAKHAESANVLYCIEPLCPGDTNFINTVAEAVRMIDAVGSPALRTMVDSRSASEAEQVPVAQVLERWLPTGKACHVHVNDPNRRGPGQGNVEFGPIFAALVRLGYSGTVSVEPFDYYPNGPASAARAIGYIRGILEGMKSKVDPVQ
jgi:D-psicose/D-tagatose/L-ribulose 3-epimerase